MFLPPNLSLHSNRIYFKGKYTDFFPPLFHFILGYPQILNYLTAFTQLLLHKVTILCMFTGEILLGSVSKNFPVIVTAVVCLHVSE